MSRHIKYGLQIVTPNAARGRIGEIYSQVKQDLMQVPEPFSIHSLAPDILAGVWGIFRESLVAGQVDRGLKETVAATVAKINRCPWCVDAHSIALYATGRASAAKVISDEDVAVDPVTESAIAWASATRTPGSTILRNPPFPTQDLLEIIGTAITFHYLTRMVSALLDETFMPRQRWLQKPLKQALGAIFASRARRSVSHGETVHFLPAAEVPVDFAWALPSPAIATAFAQFASVMGNIDSATLPSEVRALADQYIATWNGEDLGLSRHWVNDAVEELKSNLQPTAKLVLLSALAPHQIDEALVRDYRRLYSGDDKLIQILAYGSFIAARRIGTWLAPSATHTVSNEPVASIVVEARDLPVHSTPK